MTDEIYNSIDVIDSKDIIERINDLEEERARLEAAVEITQIDYDKSKSAVEIAQENVDAAEDSLGALNEEFEDTSKLKEELESCRLTLEEAQEKFDKADIAFTNATNDLDDWDFSDEEEELEALVKLADEASSSSNWKYGETLIRDSYFEKYAQQLAEDIGLLTEKSYKWPYSHIDWGAAADELKSDYISVDFDGEDYWIRA